VSAPDSTVLAVRGTWTGEVPPELARVRIAVGARSGDRAHALRDLTRRVEEVRAAVTGYGDAVESVEDGALWVHPQFKDGRPRERVTGYVAGLHVTVTVVQFDVLGDLLLRLADRDLVGVEGPFWELRPDSDAHRHARREAVSDARRRAEEYAAALGSRLTGLVELADVGMSGREGVAVAPAMFSRVAHDSVADEVGFDVRPVPQPVHAAVEARFTCSRPEL
jgi:uncharacterized protein